MGSNLAGIGMLAVGGFFGGIFTTLMPWSNWAWESKVRARCRRALVEADPCATACRRHGTLPCTAPFALLPSLARHPLTPPLAHHCHRPSCGALQQWFLFSFLSYLVFPWLLAFATVDNLPGT
jgi:hypothetical protein